MAKRQVLVQGTGGNGWGFHVRSQRCWLEGLRKSSCGGRGGRRQMRRSRPGAERIRCARGCPPPPWERQSVGCSTARSHWITCRSCHCAIRRGRPRSTEAHESVVAPGKAASRQDAPASIAGGSGAIGDRQRGRHALQKRCRRWRLLNGPGRPDEARSWSAPGLGVFMPVDRCPAASTAQLAAARASRENGRAHRSGMRYRGYPSVS